MFDRGGSPPRPHHDLQLHPRHAQLLPWISEPRAWTMDLISGIVVQWWWCRYGYGIPPYHEYHMRHGSCLTGEDHPTDHNMDHKLHPRHAQLLPWILELRAWTMIFISNVVFQEWWCRYGYAIPPLHEYYVSHVPRLTWVDHPLYHHMTSNYTQDILSCYPGYWNQDLELWTLSVM